MMRPKNGYHQSRIKVIFGDPANSPDFFGFCGGDILLKERLLYVRFAKQWTGLSFRQAALKMKPIYDKVMPDIFAMEKNNRGMEAIREFRNQQMPIMPVTTSSTILDKKRWDVIDKPYTIRWIKSVMRKHIIRFPTNHSLYMQVLLDQIAQIVQYHTPSGRTGYHALNSRHDDIFSGFVGFCHFGRLYLS